MSVIRRVAIVYSCVCFLSLTTHSYTAMAITSYNNGRKGKVILFKDGSLKINISASLIQHKLTTAYGIDVGMFPHCKDVPESHRQLLRASFMAL
jgi:hypothetical protein